jgi:uncharacterized phiE125 gp8 family phage protein
VDRPGFWLAAATPKFSMRRTPVAVLSYSDVLTTGPTIEPLSVEDARRNADLDDSAWDADIRRWITQARKRVEHDARLALINQTRTRKLHYFPGDVGAKYQELWNYSGTYAWAGSYLELDSICPLSSGTSVAYVDTAGNSQTMASGDYTVDTARRPGVIWLKSTATWPLVSSEVNNVTITYVVGHGTTAASVPEEAVSAMTLLIRHWFDFPDLAGTFVGRTNPEAYDSMIAALSWGAYP